MLALDSAHGACAVGVFEGARCIAQCTEHMQRGQASRLPTLVSTVLAIVGPSPIGLIAVTVGPGSFTGIRAGLALAHGMAAGWSVPIVGVGVVEALAYDIPGTEAPIWVALHSRPGRVFLAWANTLASYALDALPPVTVSPMLTGNAAPAVAARLQQRGDQVRLHPADLPSLDAIAAIGLERYRGKRLPLPAQSLYVDGPEARLPAGS